MIPLGVRENEDREGSRRKVFGPRFGPNASTHAGLWLERFIPNLGAKAAPADHIASLRAIGIPAGYLDFCRRRREALEKLPPKTLVARATVQGRLAIGLGQESVLETSVTLHHTWGVPCLPGSALKGLAARVARQKLDSPWNPAEEAGPYSVVFGRLEDSGFVTFHDALWIEDGTALPLDPDVLTVHHPDYYGGKDALPVEWDEPNPVSFVTCRGGYEILLTGPEGWVDAAFDLLTVGLEQEGLGAKTASGYGRFQVKREGPPPFDLEGALRRLDWKYARTEVPIILNSVAPAALREAAQRIITSLKRSEVRSQRRQPWVQALLAAAGEQ